MMNPVSTMKNFDYSKLPVQAQAVLLVGAISVAFLVAKMAGLRGEKQKFSAMVLGVSVLAVTFSTYNIRCLITGKCENWATLMAVTYVISQGSALMQM